MRSQPGLIPSRMKNTQSFSAFCTYLGAPLKNVADRWCGYNAVRGFAVFTLWADRLHGDRYVLWDATLYVADRRIGATELRGVLSQVMASGHAAYGIRCEPCDRRASPRKRGYFDEDELLVLNLHQDDSDIVANVLGTIQAADVAAGDPGEIAPFESAIDDLGPAPRGNAKPDKATTVEGTGYRRDRAVREFVLRRSQGRCEYCGAFGFEMPDGSRYLEAHHVISLATEGPDTVKNVIALCAGHHREAHYGKDAENLESAFSRKLLEIAN